MMNLRQKVKQAKKELLIVEEKYRNASTFWEIYEKHKIESRLRKVIDYKRKPSRVLHWNEEHEIDWGKLTYIALEADYRNLLTIKSPNGKPFTEKQLKEFVCSCLIKINAYGLKVQKKESDKKKYTDYVLLVSADRTKQKRFHPEKLYRQYNGDDKLYPYS